MIADLLVRLPFLGKALSQAGERSFWLPPRSSSVAVAHDWLFYFILWICVFFLALIVVLMLVFIVKYRARDGRQPEPRADHNLALELAWTGIPMLLVVAIFWYGFKGYMALAVAPQNSYQVIVTGQKWKWLFTYPNGYVDEKLHVPVDKPVQLVMSSEDVIHSFYVPAFRVKRDVVPGRFNKMWFRGIQAGEFQVMCAEYCGQSHSEMLTSVVVHEPGQFERWLEEAADFISKMPPVDAGRLLYEKRGCTQCHSVDGTKLVGPTFKGVFGRSEQMDDGSRVTADEDYLRESILNPGARIVAGYDPVMPTFQGRLKDAEIAAIIEYLKTLGP